MKIGMIQGRLSKPREGFQECPKKWQREFYLMEQIGLNHIEWIVTKESFKDNPFFSEDLKKYPIHSVCADNLVDKKIDNIRYVKKNLDPICKSAVKILIKFMAEEIHNNFF